MMFAILLVPLLAALGVAIDAIRSNQVKTELAEALDAGLLAASRAKILDTTLTDAQATAIARRTFDANRSQRSDISISNFDFRSLAGGERFEIDLGGVLQTAILGVVGIDTVDLDIVAETRVGQPGPVELVLVLDNTGSMAGSKIATLRTASTSLIDTLDNVIGGDFKYGLVPFAQYVNVDTANAGEPWLSVPADSATSTWEGCVGSRDNPFDDTIGNFASQTAPGLLDVNCPSAIAALTGNPASIKSDIQAMTAGGSTYIPAGMIWGMRVLDSEAPFTGGIPFADVAANQAKKIIVLMTDGANTRSSTFPDHEGTNVAAANTQLDTVCAIAEANDVVVFSVAFEVNDPTIQSVLTNCATDTGGFFDADNASQLTASFDAIAANIAALSLSR